MQGRDVDVSRHYRRQILEALKQPWEGELEWVTALAVPNPKNYQIWWVNLLDAGVTVDRQHRRWCLECALREGKDVAAVARSELQFIEDFLTNPTLHDAKNYHAWTHR